MNQSKRWVTAGLCECERGTRQILEVPMIHAESSLTLDLNEMLRDGFMRPMSSRLNGTLVWRNVATGEETSRLGCAAHLDEQSGHMRLNYTITRYWTGERIPVEYVIQLWTTAVSAS